MVGGGGGGGGRERSEVGSGVGCGVWRDGASTGLLHTHGDRYGITYTRGQIWGKGRGDVGGMEGEGKGEGEWFGGGCAGMECLAGCRQVHYCVLAELYLYYLHVVCGCRAV